MSDAKKDEEKKEGGEEAPKPKGKKKLIIIIVAVLLLVGAGGAFAMMGGKKESADGEHAEETKHEEVHLQLAKLDTFIVNLSENSAFVKVTMLIEYDPKILEKVTGGGHGEGGGGGYGGGGSGGGEGGANPTALPPTMKIREPMVRDTVIRILSSKKADEVLTPDGKDKLKEELVEGINEALGFDDAPVVNIYFTEFLIQ